MHLLNYFDNLILLSFYVPTFHIFILSSLVISLSLSLSLLFFHSFYSLYHFISVLLLFPKRFIPLSFRYSLNVRDARIHNTYYCIIWNGKLISAFKFCSICRCFWGPKFYSYFIFVPFKTFTILIDIPHFQSLTWT